MAGNVCRVGDVTPSRRTGTPLARCSGMRVWGRADPSFCAVCSRVVALPDPSDVREGKRGPGAAQERARRSGRGDVQSSRAWLVMCEVSRGTPGPTRSPTRASRPMSANAKAIAGPLTWSPFP
jgi:hypothetical protein